MESDGQVRFGRFRLDLASESLWRGRKPVALSPKEFAALTFLIDHAGRLVTKEELRQAIWDDPLASDASIKVCIGELRKALGDRPQSPTIIQTVHRRGYRFIAPLLDVLAGDLTGSMIGGQSEFAADGFAAQVALGGREAELAQLKECLERALRGNRQVVFIGGEPGVGKTALVQAFLDHVDGRHAAWSAVGQCMLQHVPGEAFRPMLEVLGRLVQRPGGERLISTLGRCAPTWLGRLSFPKGSPAGRSGSPRGATERSAEKSSIEAGSDVLASANVHARMLREMDEALAVFTAATPLVLVFEDLQAGDSATLDLISSLARRREPARLMVIGAYCPADASRNGSPLKTLKRDLQSHGKCHDLRLALLNEAAVREYIELHFPGSDFARDVFPWIQQHTEGNPLFISTLVQDLQDRQIIIRTDDGRWMLARPLPDFGRELPGTIRSLIAEQIGQLAAEDRRLLALAAIQGPTFDTAALAGAMGLGDATIEERLEILETDHNLVRFISDRELPDGSVTRCYDFVHALHRMSLLATLAPARTAALGVAIASALVRQRRSGTEV